MPTDHPSVPSGPSEPSGPSSGTFTIHYFASAGAYTGKSHEALPAPLPLRRLFDVLEERYPGMKGKVLESCSVSVGLEYVDVDVEDVEDPGTSSSAGGVVIGVGEEVGIIPPVSSG